VIGAAIDCYETALLLNQLFWQHRTEVGIAAELHISQPAVNKRTLRKVKKSLSAP
jgi:hypothetical protein